MYYQICGTFRGSVYFRKGHWCLQLFLSILLKSVGILHGQLTINSMEQSPSWEVLSYSRSSPHFMETECSLPHLQASATCPYPEPDRPSPYLPSHFSKPHFNIIFPSTPGCSRWCPSLKFPTKTLYASLLSIVPATYPAYLILLDLITRAKWFPVTTAWRVLRLRMEERPPVTEGTCEYIE